NRSAIRRGAAGEQVRPLYSGAAIRSWGFDGDPGAIFPYDDVSRRAQIHDGTEKILWPNRTLLRRRKALSGTQEDQGLTWFEYSSFSPKRYWAPLLIAFAFVATHNEFSLRR